MRDFGKALEGLEIDFDLSSEGLSSRSRDYLYGRLETIAYREMCNSDNPYAGDFAGAKIKINSVLNFFWPNVAKIAELEADPTLSDKLSIWPNIYARKKGRAGRSQVKIGRAIRKMFPVLTEVEIDSLVDDVKLYLLPKDWTVKTGSDRASFKKAYSFCQSESENLETTHTKKHMSNSCMRYEFSDLCCHPAEAYASGDFTVYWLEDAKGNIGGRVVVYFKGNKPYPAPIYAVSESAFQKLWDKLTDINAKPTEERSWIGARLLLIPDRGGYVGPYLDLTPRALEESDCGNYLVIDSHGSIDGSVYSGLYNDEETVRCYDCECRISHDESYGWEGFSYCQSCYYERAFTCENCHEDESVDEQQWVMVRDYYGHNNEQSWCRCCVDSNAAVTENGELWSDDCVIHTADCSVIDPVTADEDYFMCMLNGEYYPNELAQVLADGQVVSSESIQDHNARSSITGTIYAYDATREFWFLQVVKDKDVA